MKKAITIMAVIMALSSTGYGQEVQPSYQYQMSERERAHIEYLKEKQRLEEENNARHRRAVIGWSVFGGTMILTAAIVGIVAATKAPTISY